MHNFEGIFRKTRIELGMASSLLSRIKICLVRRFLFYTFLNPSTFEFLLTVRLILDGVESSLVGVVSLAVDCMTAASDGSPQVWSLFHWLNHLLSLGRTRLTFVPPGSVSVCRGSPNEGPKATDRETKLLADISLLCLAQVERLRRKKVHQFFLTKHVSYQAVGVAVAVVTAVAGAIIWIVCSCCFSAKR